MVFCGTFSQKSWAGGNNPGDDLMEKIRIERARHFWEKKFVLPFVHAVQQLFKSDEERHRAYLAIVRSPDIPFHDRIETFKQLDLKDPQLYQMLQQILREQPKGKDAFYVIEGARLLLATDPLRREILIGIAGDPKEHEYRVCALEHLPHGEEKKNLLRAMALDHALDPWSRMEAADVILKKMDARLGRQIFKMLVNDEKMPHWAKSSCAEHLPPEDPDHRWAGSWRPHFDDIDFM